MPYIDGLRAIAILLVVGFHAGLPGIAGGFVGVDVFFVISGYLITGLLVRELAATGRIGILDFYARRARRLLPALSIVLIATLIGGAILLLPFGEQQDLAKSAIAASAFLGNVFFWRTQSDYFAGPSEEMPLLHLWTLATEEQFYIVWPIVMLLGAGAAARRRKERLDLGLIVGVLVLGSLLSFAACWWFTPRRWTLVFYNMPFRAWEFGIGALIALFGMQVARSSLGRVTSSVLAIIGVGMILAAGTLFNRTTLFPGVNAVLPVLGAGTTILALSRSPECLVGRVLASPPMVGIGKTSYALYLWHWPLLALARAHALGETSLSRDVTLVILALALSVLTHVFIEEPVRRQKPWPFTRPAASVLGGLALMTLTVVGAAVLWGRANLVLARNPAMRAAEEALEAKVDLPTSCGNFRFDFSGLPPRSDCTFGSDARTAPLVLLWGDSHAHHFIPALQVWAQATGARLLPRVSGACKPTFAEVPDGLERKQVGTARDCVAYNDAVSAELPALKAEGARAVILSARWAVPSQLQVGLGDWESALRARIAEIRSLGLDVIVIAEVPRPLKRVPQCVARRGEEACGRGRADVDAERQSMISVLDRIARMGAGVSVIDLAGALCDAATCRVVGDGAILYKDDHHLSIAGAQRLADTLGSALRRVSSAY